MDNNMLNPENVSVITLSGRLDSYTIAASRKLLEDAVNAELPRIVVNMQAVSFLDSTALSAFVVSLKRSRERGGNLHLCCLQQPVRMIFELTRLDKVFEMYASERDAVCAFLNE